MIGTKFNKPLTDLAAYSEAAAWANANKAMIVDQGSYYEVITVPPPPPTTIEQQIIALEAQVTPRRQREATLGIDGGWLADIDAQIADLRAQIIQPSE